nr:MAG: replication initiator protein [Microvirus sp.]
MPCYHPLQAKYSVSDSGKKQIVFSSPESYDARLAFEAGQTLPSNFISLPCGTCMGCRLEKSRQWALRCMHEASLHEDNCFLTLTYDEEFLPSDGSLNKSHFQLFLKRLRRSYDDVRIRYYSCGEYGENFGRPHYHACIFGFDFSDKQLFKRGEYKLYTSPVLDRLWGMGHCTIGDLSFESAAYVARYCTKKVTGTMAKEYYAGRQPEYATMSLKPGIGAEWYERWKGDCFPSDYLVVNGFKCKPPRYYDKRLERENPALYEEIKQRRRDVAEDDDESSYRRLIDREKCQQARFKKLIRKIEKAV